METIQYNGQNVYTDCNNRVTLQDLELAEREPATIRNAYFFELECGVPVKTNFNKERVTKMNRGLEVSIDLEKCGVAEIEIIGLDRICSFLADTQSLGSDLSVLKGQEVTSYNSGMKLIGIGVDA